MSDPFPQAIADSLAILKKIKEGFGPFPTASNDRLETLSSHARRGTRNAFPSTEPQNALPSNPHPGSQTQGVFGTGNPHADLMFLGEASGTDETAQREALTGPAGQLLTKIIQAMGATREEIYIAHVVKPTPNESSRASDASNPEETDNRLLWLQEQIALIKPRVVVALGTVAMKALFGKTEAIGRLRGRWLDFHGISVMPTYNPAYLLRNQALTEKRKVWEDLLLVLEKLEMPISEKQRRFFTRG